MLDITIAFIIFEEGLADSTKELQETIELYSKNYLVYYHFCNNYCIFSDYKLTQNEVKLLIKFIESDEGFNKLCSNGLEIEFARYTLLTNNIEIFNENKKGKIQFDQKLAKYIENVEKTTKIYELKNLLHEKKLIENENKNNQEIILQSKELAEGYKNLLTRKDEKIKELLENNSKLYSQYTKIPKVIRRLFVKESKLLG